MNANSGKLPTDENTVFNGKPAPKKNNKKDDKADKAMAGGLGAAVGVVGGVAAGTVYARAQENGGDNDAADNANAEEQQEVHTQQHVYHHNRGASSQTRTQENAENKSETKTEDGADQQHHGDEVEVIGYEKIDNGFGGESEVAIVRVNGEEMLFVDVDSDGYADMVVKDFNNNNEIEWNEGVDVTNERIAMNELNNGVVTSHDVERWARTSEWMAELDPDPEPEPEPWIEPTPEPGPEPEPWIEPDPDPFDPEVYHDPASLAYHTEEEEDLISPEAPAETPEPDYTDEMLGGSYPEANHDGADGLMDDGTAGADDIMM